MHSTAPFSAATNQGVHRHAKDKNINNSITEHAKRQSVNRHERDHMRTARTKTLRVRKSLQKLPKCFRNRNKRTQRIPRNSRGPLQSPHPKRQRDLPYTKQSNRNRQRIRTTRNSRIRRKRPLQVSISTSNRKYVTRRQPPRPHLCRAH